MKNAQWNLIIRRYLDLLIYVVLGVVICLLFNSLLSYTGSVLNNQISYLHIGVQIIIITSITAVFWTLLISYGGFRVSDLIN
jgi:hypothetical protein